MTSNNIMLVEYTYRNGSVFYRKEKTGEVRKSDKPLFMDFFTAGKTHDVMKHEGTVIENVSTDKGVKQIIIDIDNF